MAGYDRITGEGKAFLAEIKELKRLSVKVGYLSNDATMAAVRNADGSISDSEDTTIAEVAAFNELGTDAIPARPFLRNTVDNNRDKLAAFAAAQAKKLTKGGTAEDVLKAIGTYAKGLVQEEIVDGEYAGNDPATIKRKGSDKPLIDTGRLYQSVNFDIKTKGGG